MSNVQFSGKNIDLKDLKAPLHKYKQRKEMSRTNVCCVLQHNVHPNYLYTTSLEPRWRLPPGPLIWWSWPPPSCRGGAGSKGRCPWPPRHHRSFQPTLLSAAAPVNLGHHGEIQITCDSIDEWGLLKNSCQMCQITSTGTANSKPFIWPITDTESQIWAKSAKLYFLTVHLFLFKTIRIKPAATFYLKN